MSTSTDQHPEQTTRRSGAGPDEREAAPGRARLTGVVVANVVLLTMIAPLATDMYVPGFPLVGTDLDATATQVQLTLTTYFVGMALGQLVGGPVSDQRGRRAPLVAAVVAMGLASVVCAVAPSVGVMMLARLVQGFAGGWAMVIGRAVIIDLAEGARLGSSWGAGPSGGASPHADAADAVARWVVELAPAASSVDAPAASSTASASSSIYSSSRSSSSPAAASTPSIISKISLTPCNIFTSPPANLTRPFDR